MCEWRLLRGGVCATGAKATPLTAVLPALFKQHNFELRQRANVIKVNLDPDKKRAVGVTDMDARGRELELRDIYLGVWPFVIVNLFVIALVVSFPELCLIPAGLMYR